ncbi:MAG TPA: hypothetical protein DCW58_03570, partial [Candidatus Pacebacteria bacterium]|nr:hypothetical protein [Candidatus Paceibacterota bacterium]
AQKQADQQSSVLGQQGVAKQQAAAAGAGQTPLASNEVAKQQTPPREVTNLGEELIKRPVKDILDTAKSFFDLNALLGINPGDSPEKKQKKQKVAQNWQKLTQEEQSFVQQKYQEEQQKKQKEQQEEQEKKEKEEKEAEEQSIAPPSSPKKGPVGLSGSKKQQTSQLLQNRRTQMTQGDG